LPAKIQFKPHLNYAQGQERSKLCLIQDTMFKFVASLNQKRLGNFTREIRSIVMLFPVVNTNYLQICDTRR